MAGLNGSITRCPTASAVDLTSRGGADYIVANGENSYKRKDLVTSLFGTPVNTWSFDDASGAPSGYSVSGTDGKPSPSSFTVTSMYGGFVDDGTYWEITAPADTDERIIEGFFYGPFGHNFTITATLSDGSVSPLVINKNTQGSGTGDGALYRLRYSAGSAGQTVTIRMTALANANQNQVGWLWLSEPNPIYLAQSAVNSVASTATSVSSTISAPADGDLIVTFLTVDKSAGIVTAPNGFALIDSDDSTSVTIAAAFKVSNGTETSVQWNYSTAHFSHMWVGVYKNTNGFSPYDVYAKANSANGNVSTQTSGTTAGSAVDNSLAVAAWGMDSYSSIPSGIVTQSNNYVQLYNGVPNVSTSSSSLTVADKLLGIAGETTSSTADFNGASDQAAGMVVVFKPLGAETPTTITISDNTGSTLGGTEDNELDGFNVTTNHGSATQAYTDVWFSPDVIVTFILRFPLPSGAGEVANSKLRLYLTEKGGLRTALRVYQILRGDWSESESTHTIYKTGSNWDTLGAQGVGTDRGSTVLAMADLSSASTSAYIEFAGLALDALIEDLINASATEINLLVQFADLTNTTQTYGRYITSEGTDGQRPELVYELSSAGAQTLSPPLLTNEQTFYSPTVANLSGEQTLSPPLLTNEQTFYNPTVAGGAVVLSPPLLTNEQTFYSPTVTNFPIVVDHCLSGAVTHNTARVIARLSDETSDAVLEYATNSGFTGSSTTSAVNVTSGNDLIADFNLSGLSANTQYYYRVLINGVPDSITGKFKTVATGVYSFSFAFAGDADITDNQDVYTRIIARNPHFFFALGDTPYIDNTAASVTNYQNGYKNWFGDTTVSSMLQAFHYEYIWDDHDYADNNSDSSATGKTFAQATYRQHIPHRPLEVSGPIYHSFQIGRVLFLATDLRSERTGSTFMSSTQMTWFKDKITEAANDPDTGLIIWANSVPWIDTSNTSTDTWDGADAQRTEIANHIVSLGMENNFCIISADAHMVAADDGTNSEGGFPVFHSAPLNRSNSTKGGPYTFGPYADSNGQYSVMTITDNGTDIDINVKGYNGSDTQLYTYDFTAPPLNQEIVAPLLTNNQTFHSPTVSQGAAPQTLEVPLLTNEQTFYDPTVSVGEVNISVPLLTNEQTFYSPSATSVVGISVPLLTNEQIFYDPAVSVGGVTLSAPLLTNQQTFHDPVVSLGAAPQIISPPLLTNAQTFYSPTVATGSVTLLAPLLSAQAVLYTPIVNSGTYTIEAPLLISEQTFYSPVVNSVYEIEAPLLDSSSELFSPEVSVGTANLAAPLLNAQAILYVPQVLSGGLLDVPLLVSTPEFFLPEVLLMTVPPAGGKFKKLSENTSSRPKENFKQRN